MRVRLRAGRSVRRALGVLAVVAVATMAGFLAALLRGRPPTSYAGALRQPVRTRDGG
jgi:hypothetical protein